MNNKFSSVIQKETEDIIEKINSWKKLFNVKIEYYFDGWAIFLREKCIYPRSIIIFKSYEKDSYSIKSFEIYLQNFNKEEFKELYSSVNITNQNDLLKELKEIIYGKDLLKNASKIYNNTFS